MIMIIFIIIPFLNEYVPCSNTSIRYGVLLVLNLTASLLWFDVKPFPFDSLVSYIPRFANDDGTVLIQSKLQPSSDFFQYFLHDTWLDCVSLSKHMKKCIILDSIWYEIGNVPVSP